MIPNATQQYLQNEILSADPIHLVRLAYEGAIRFIGEARALLRAGDIAGRSRKIMRAHAVLAELASSIDHARGGELSRSLSGLYDYVQCRLLDGNFRQREEPLAEAESLLRTLLEGWEQCQRAADAEPAPRVNPAYRLPAAEAYESVSVAG